MVTTPLSGNVAIITGGSGGLGRAICRRLANDGAKVVVHYQQSEDKAQELVAELEDKGQVAIIARSRLLKSGQSTSTSTHACTGLATSAPHSQLDKPIRFIVNDEAHKYTGYSAHFGA